MPLSFFSNPVLIKSKPRALPVEVSATCGADGVEYPGVSTQPAKTCCCFEASSQFILGNFRFQVVPMHLYPVGQNVLLLDSSGSFSP